MLMCKKIIQFSLVNEDIAQVCLHNIIVIQIIISRDVFV